ncbi:MAG: hypothetical protein EOM26_00075 [Alphaproteobacteria bacterium]|nr:hypothetical protein [Alphaproteobacteria bacterium]
MENSRTNIIPLKNETKVRDTMEAQRITHESEAQRQHVRLQIPAKAEIAGNAYPVKDISSGGIRVEAAKPVVKKSGLADIRLIFPFAAFSMDLCVKGQAVHFDKDRKTAGFRFTELGQSQMSILNHIIKATMAGAMVTEGDVIHILSRDNFVNARNDNRAKKKRGVFFFVRRAVAMLLILGLGGLALAFVAGNLYENNRVLKAYEGKVVSENVIVRSPAEGVFEPLIPPGTTQVAMNQPLGTIRRGGGLQNAAGVTLKSPCDCYIVERFVRPGEFRGMGESVFKMVPIESRPYISTTLPPEQALRLRLQDDANIRIAGEGTFIEGNVVGIETEQRLNEMMTTVQVRPSELLPIDVIGRPAYVEFLVY